MRSVGAPGMGNRIVLVNANLIRPPIAPIGLEYVATAVEDAGFAVEVADLSWSSGAESALRATLGERPLLVGLTLRNLDDSSAASRASFVGFHRDVVAMIHRLTDAPVVLGGAGFSISPAAAIAALGADFAVHGDGEQALLRLSMALNHQTGEDDWLSIPGLLFRASGRIHGSPPRPIDLAALPAPRRIYVDNRRYLSEGAQIGFETSRGCAARCTYCADPIAKGRSVRCRAPASIADEIAQLVRAGVDTFHTCDSEFNAARRHALDVCRTFSERGLGDSARWYAYCAPSDFDDELARAMRQAGCVGVNFGVDHVDDSMLSRLGRAHRLVDIERSRAACRNAGLAVMFDLLLGAPGETWASICSAIETMRRLAPDAIGIALGVRLYRGAPLADELAPHAMDSKKGVTNATDDLLEPSFFVEPTIEADCEDRLAAEIGEDPRFFYLGASDRNDDLPSYNYNENRELEGAIARGARGAYWDILRKLRAGQL
jgi:radical SAM superfamily enzyme YgiQ (UPF0313 family)